MRPPTSCRQWASGWHSVESCFPADVATRACDSCLVISPAQLQYPIVTANWSERSKEIWHELENDAPTSKGALSGKLVDGFRREPGNGGLGQRPDSQPVPSTQTAPAGTPAVPHRLPARSVTLEQALAAAQGLADTQKGLTAEQPATTSSVVVAPRHGPDRRGQRCLHLEPG
jgi:hypothetical protein